MSLPVQIIDAFAIGPFTGNPAAICLVDSMSQLNDEWMQNLAVEMNLSETAFVDLSTYEIRWFTPAAEVDLCGHATLGAVKALVNSKLLSVGEQVTFQSRSGPLVADALDVDEIQLDFPSTPPKAIIPPCDLKKVFGDRFDETVGYVGASRFDLLVEFPNEERVVNFEPDFGIMKKSNYRGVMITAKSDSDDLDFVSRFFAPAFGVDEDPVTGSAHCCLAPFWSNKLQKTEMTAMQMSKRRGLIKLKVEGDRVKLAGKAYTILKGNLTKDAYS